MWRITIISNVFLMGLFWLASLVSMSMAHNRLVQYVENGLLTAIPLITDWALSVRLWAGLIPLVWAIFSFVIWRKVSDKQPESRTEYLLAFTTITLITGCAMLIFFTLGGILPFLYIGAAIK